MSNPTGRKFQPYVPGNVSMQEFTIRAVALGLVMSVVLGAANAYLGLRAGITIAATYPAAVISMAVLRLWRASILEENLARTAGSIGESVAAGAIFTIPAFLIARVWPSFGFADSYWKSTMMMVIGGVLGVLFVSLVRREMVEDPELPFPESVAASEIHKAGQAGSSAAGFLFKNMLVGAAAFLGGVLQLYAPDKNFFIRIGELGQSLVRLGGPGARETVATGATTTVAGPSVLPAYIGVGYIIGPRLAALNFAGGVLAWGLLVPLLMYFLGPQLVQYVPEAQNDTSWGNISRLVWQRIVRPIAVGGMLVGASYTLFRMRKSLSVGLGRAVGELRGGAAAPEAVARTQRYMSNKVVLMMLGVTFLLLVLLYVYISGNTMAGVVAAIVMLVVGFFFATVSGYLVGVIGSSNNPVSGLTLSTLVIAGLLLVSLGVGGTGGVAAVLGVAAVICVSSAVAGELFQDFKAGYILGGTPRTIQIVELFAVVISALVMWFPLFILHEGNIKAGGIGFGDPQIPAPQAGLMASLAQGIVGGEMAWPLVVVGILFGIGMILLQVRSPMLVATGMYLPLGTTATIFIGGVFRWVTDSLSQRAGHNEAQRIRVENIGILTASGMIVGEALVGLAVATARFFEVTIPTVFEEGSYLIGVLVMALLGFILVRTALANAGRADEPAPPSAMV